MLFENLKPGLMPREICSAAGIITLLSLPSMQTHSNLTTLHPPHPLLMESALTLQILPMLNKPYLGTMKLQEFDNFDMLNFANMLILLEPS